MFRRDTSPVLWGLHKQKRPGQVFSIDTTAILDACTTLMSRTLINKCTYTCYQELAQNYVLLLFQIRTKLCTFPNSQVKTVKLYTGIKKRQKQDSK